MLLQAGQRFLSTTAHAQNQSRARLFALGAASSIAAGGLLLSNHGTVQAKQKEVAADMRYKHVIIGAGVAARSCLKTLNDLDKSSLPEGYDGKVCIC